MQQSRSGLDNRRRFENWQANKKKEMKALNIRLYYTIE